MFCGTIANLYQLEKYPENLRSPGFKPINKIFKTSELIFLVSYIQKMIVFQIVYVARNPKDMCVSYYHYCILVHSMRGTFEEFCDLFLKDKAPVGPIWNHILGFWRRRDEPNVLFLKYEDMKRVRKRNLLEDNSNEKFRKIYR